MSDNPAWESESAPAPGSPAGEPATGEAAAGDKRGADLKTREAGLRLVMRLAGLIRIGRSYQVGNQVFNEQMRTFYDSLKPVLDESHEVVLVALDTDLYLNGFRIPVRSGNMRFHQSVHDEFRLRKIAGLKIEAGLDPEELERFFTLFMQPAVYHGTSLLEACLANHVDRILPAVHASTEAPEMEFGLPDDEEDEPAPEDAWSDGSAGSEEEEEREEAVRPGVPDGAVRKNYSVAMQGTRSLLATTSLHEGFQLKHAKRVVQPMVDGAFKHEPVVVGLSVLRQHDEYTYAHAVNVCMVAVSMGYYLELDRRSLADLGVAALLHDVGKATVAHLIKRPIDEFTDDERAAAERHSIEGAKLLARTTTMNPTSLRCMRVALEHHLPQDPTGAPARPGKWSPNVLSRIVSVADCYVSLQTHRSRRGQNITPSNALGMMLGPMRRRFDAAILWSLVQTVGLYPPGQMIELSDGTLAVVLAPNPDGLERPRVRVLTDRDKNLLAWKKTHEWQPLPDDMSVVRALETRDYPEALRDPRASAA
ncbi:MAG: HD domain-containing phosphohydrolase [Candidatus Eisenbacteria bacterium]